MSGTSKHRIYGNKVFRNLKGQTAKNITSEEYKEVVSKTLLPEGRRLFTQGAGVSTWTIMQDNDPSHKIAVSNSNESMQGASLIESWPPNSPPESRSFKEVYFQAVGD